MLRRARNTAGRSERDDRNFMEQGGIDWGRAPLKRKRRLNEEKSGIGGRPTSAKSTLNSGSLGPRLPFMI